jgi:predicted kinase
MSNRKKYVFITIGLPSSGKSTHVKKLIDSFGEDQCIRLNADMIREELTGDATCQDRNNEVFKIHHARYKEYLVSNEIKHSMIFIDNTSLTKKMRSQYWKFAKEVGVECHFHISYFDVSPEVCLERQKGRERKVPEDVIRRMYTQIQRPDAEELKSFGSDRYVTLV